MCSTQFWSQCSSSQQTLKGFQAPSGAELEEEAEPACYDVKLLFGPLLSSINSSGKGGPTDVPVTEVMVQGRLEVMILPDLAVAALPQDFNEVERTEKNQFSLPELFPPYPHLSLTYFLPYLFANRLRCRWCQ
jgi:hypothetical protein